MKEAQNSIEISANLIDRRQLTVFEAIEAENLDLEIFEISESQAICIFET